MVGAPSFPEPHLCIQPLLQPLPKIRSSTSVNFHLPIPLLLVHKIILTIPTNTTFLYTSTPKIFSLPQPFRQFRLRQWTKKLESLKNTDTILISPFFLKVWTVITGLTITDSLLLSLRKLVYCRY